MSGKNSGSVSLERVPNVAVEVIVASQKKSARLWKRYWGDSANNWFVTKIGILKPRTFWRLGFLRPKYRPEIPSSNFKSRGFFLDFWISGLFISSYLCSCDCCFFIYGIFSPVLGIFKSLSFIPGKRDLFQSCLFSPRILGFFMSGIFIPGVGHFLRSWDSYTG